MEETRWGKQDGRNKMEETRWRKQDEGQIFKKDKVKLN